MKKHVILATFILALSAYGVAQQTYPSSGPQDQVAATQPNAKLSKHDRKRLEKQEKKEDKKLRDQQGKEEKHVQQKQTEEQRKQYKQQEKQVAKERERELREQEKHAAVQRREQQKQVAAQQHEQEKQVAAQQKNEQKYERKEAQHAAQQEAKDINRHMQHEARAERAGAASAPAPRQIHLPRIPISTSATPGLLMAQREVGRAIYTQLPSSDVRVLLDGGNQIVLRGSAPNPSLKRRLLQLAIGAARGYSVVDQLAANFVGDAATAATSAAIGGVSDLIHRSDNRDRDKDTEPPTASDPLPQSAQQGSYPEQSLPDQSSAYPQQPLPNPAAAYPDQPASIPAPAYPNPALPNPALPSTALPNSDTGAATATTGILEPGSNACVNLSNSSQVLLTGQVGSQPSAELIRNFARDLASPSAALIDQLAVRTTGIPSAASAPGIASAPSGGTTTTANSAATVVTPGSTVCVTENNGALLLTGTVGQSADLATVEHWVQPLIGSGRLLDQLTIGSTSSATQSAASAPVANAGPAASTTSAAQAPAAQTSTASAQVPAATTGEIEVEQALHSIPRLSNVAVEVRGDRVHLTGSVDRTEDDQMAADIARQYAAGRPVVDNVAIANRTQPQPQLHP